MVDRSIRRMLFPPLVRLAGICLVCTGLVLPANAQQVVRSAEALYEQGYLAWDAGDYPTALDAFEAAIETPGGDAVLERIALVTGEPFRTVEIASDGTDPVWGADGSVFTYRTPSSEPGMIHIVDVDAGDLGAVRGYGPAISPTAEKIAYLRLDESDELESERERLRQENPVEDRESFFRLRRLLTELEARYSRVMIMDPARKASDEMPVGDLVPYELAYGSSAGELYAVAGEPGADGRGIYRLGTGARTAVLRSQEDLSGLEILPGARRAVVSAGAESFLIVNLEDGSSVSVLGSEPVASADGSHVAFLREDGDETVLLVRPVDGEETDVFRSDRPVSNAALSADGRMVVFQHMPRENQELFMADSDGTSARRITYDVQHDLFPRFVSNAQVLGVMGEGRHRRSYVIDLESLEKMRLFHNNTIRTVAPEYEWALSPDGEHLLVVSERDGDTISPERGLYLVDMARRVDRNDVLERIRTMREAETTLRMAGRQAFDPIADDVRTTVADFSVTRIYGYEADLFAYGSKYITEPGNAKAIEYLEQKLLSFGYEPELQWFEPRDGVRTANVIATLPGTVDPELIYVISSHFDSVQRGPGADDNTSGTAALLEAARVLREHPQPATIQFAFFTGEEAGLLGSREFVRRAVETGDRIVGALNNDMVGYANDNRLDNTIRYSNDGIRDIQHAAAFLFTDLITYDARYYKFTDAHAYYEAYGDIVGGIGSYPILANPHYHQSHDVLETINHRLVTEVGKTTAATIMLLASSPSRLTGLSADRRDDVVTVSWSPSPETGVTAYEGVYTNTAGEDQHIRAITAEASLMDAAPGSTFRVRAVGASDLKGWDWARVEIP